jgi:hypothetical protein
MRIDLGAQRPELRFRQQPLQAFFAQGVEALTELYADGLEEGELLLHQRAGPMTHGNLDPACRLIPARIDAQRGAHGVERGIDQLVRLAGAPGGVVE